jgi:hypothetical protein
MLQPSFLQLAVLCVHECNLLKLGVKICSNKIVRLLSPEPWLVCTTKFTRAWEPTLSWNQFHSRLCRELVGQTSRNSEGVICKLVKTKTVEATGVETFSFTDSTDLLKT